MYFFFILLIPFFVAIIAPGSMYLLTRIKYIIEKDLRLVISLYLCTIYHKCLSESIQNSSMIHCSIELNCLLSILSVL